MNATSGPLHDTARCRTAVLVLGPHRSGTSALTRGLVCAGIDLGRDVLAANADNPKGFFENARLVEFNDRLLKHLGLCWDSFGHSDLAGRLADLPPDWRNEAATLIRSQFGPDSDIAVKDPRLCLLAPFWDGVLDEAGYRRQYVLVIRHPVECAESQRRRHVADPRFHFVGGSITEGVLLWASYMEAALRFLADRPFLCASHAALIDDPSTSLGALLTQLGFCAPAAELQEFIHGFIDPALYHHRADAATTDRADGFSPYVQVYQDLLAPRPDAAALGRRLERLIASDAALLGTTQRCYVRARHAAVEAGLELLEAKRIIAFQEHMLAENQRKIEEHQNQLDEAKRQFAAERRKSEELAVALAACEDRRRVTGPAPRPAKHHPEGRR
ncbi:hypothetical protein AAG565_03285 [Fontimonas sp. SYSU GA230001]|uniref:hypothetical protein n=1 Tax=Fontimonas sp. SYSU GA230001 TaxID=3142450 RepID=UPI0032B57449